MKINQFHSGTAFGDAITNQMILIKQILLEEGYESEIYAQHIDKNIKVKILDIKKYECNENDILIIHHSMGFDGYEDIISLKCKKILIYHNITPEKYIQDEYIKKYVKIGLKQAEEYKNHIDYAIADSNYNRRDLINMGYSNKIDVMPVQISIDRFDKIKSCKKLVEKYSYEGFKNILFVGRVSNNKCQDDIIRTFNLFNKHFVSKSRLFIVGDNNNEAYFNYLKRLTEELNISNNVIFTGKVTEEELKSYYELADIFLCMSEHEGFGVPLLESMKMQVPVLSYESSAIPETMGGAGIIFDKKNHLEIAGLVNEVINDVHLYNKIIEIQNRRIEVLKNTNTRDLLLKAIQNTINNERKKNIQIEGPFETSYSLAIVNRKLAEAMHKMKVGEISIYATEGPGDYEPKSEDLIDKPLAKQLWKKSAYTIYPDVTIRNMYPPRVNDVKGALNFQSFAWEETLIPKKYIDDFNKHLDGIGTTSNFVTESLKMSGLNIPVMTIGNGVDLPENFNELKPYKLKTKKNVKFLHVSSCFPRKGVDILLKSYFEEFTDKDDVCLIIKTFPNIHNNIEYTLGALKNKFKDSSPEVEIINRDLPQDEIYSLYKSVDCYVQVSRGEGFGLPVAEAMLAKLPVIVSNNTGMADFCNNENSLIVDYVMEPAGTHLSDDASMWALPNSIKLRELMNKFVNSKEELNIEEKVQRAYNLIKNQYSWDVIAQSWDLFIKDIEKSKFKKKVDMITTWNTKCGIAEYTKFLCDELSYMVKFSIYPNSGVDIIGIDGENVNDRIWESAFEGDLDNLISRLNESDSEIIHIQFNFGFYKLSEIKKLIEKLYERKKIIITYHSIKDVNISGKIASLKSISTSLNKVINIVHQIDEINELEEKGILKENIIHIPLGQVRLKEYDKNFLRNKLDINRSLVLGSYGFLLPQKGIKENLIALNEIKKKYNDVLYIVSCSLYEGNISLSYYDECKSIVEKYNLHNNVLFFTDFLNPEESNVLLQLCDVILMTYLPTNESASGAIRSCLAAKRPIITTKQNIFNEFAECTKQIDDNSPYTIISAIEEVLKDVNYYTEKMQEKIEATSWQVIGRKYLELYDGINI